MSSDVVTQLRRHLEAVETAAPPITVEELRRTSGRLVAPEPASGADLTVFDLRHPEWSAAPVPRNRRPALLAVAAVVLMVIAVTVALVGDDSADERGSTTSATPPEPVPTPTATVAALPTDQASVFGDGQEVRPHVASVSAGGPGLVAVGSSTVGCCDGPVVPELAAVWTSVDGMTWSQVPHDPAVFSPARHAHQTMEDVTAAGPGLVAVGAMDWDIDAWPPGSTALVWTSVDGTAWSLVPHDEAIFGGPGHQFLTGVTAGGPGVVAVGGDTGFHYKSVDAAVWTSVDGAAWSRVPHAEAVFGGAEMHSVTLGGPGLVAVGSSGLSGDYGDADDAWEAHENFTTDAAVWTSVDGIAWSRVPHDDVVFGGLGNQSMSKVIAAGPGLVAIGIDGDDDSVDAAVWTSVDGIAWTRVPHDDAVFGGAGLQEMSDVTVGGPGLVAVGFDGRCEPDVCRDVDAAVWASTDGITWARVATSDEALAVAGSQWMSSVASTDGMLVAVGGDQTGLLEAAVWTSTDGTTWSRVTLGPATPDEAD